MRLLLGLAAVAMSLPAAPVPAAAQPGPPGSYLRQCRDVRMEGQFLHASCRGRYGWAQSSINVASCSTDIGVDSEGGLVCGGPGAVGPSAQVYPPVAARPPGHGNWSATIYDRSGFRGRALRIDGDMPNLDRTGFNDRVASIALGRRTGPWLVCSDANFRGRCVTIDRNVRDLRQVGMPDQVSSLRPLREPRY